MKLRTGQSPGNRHWPCERPTTKIQACVQNKKISELNYKNPFPFLIIVIFSFICSTTEKKMLGFFCISFLATVIHFISHLLLKTMPSTHWEKRWKGCVGRLWWREYFSYLPGCSRKFISSTPSCSGSDRCLTYPKVTPWKPSDTEGRAQSADGVLWRSLMRWKVAIRKASSC